MTARLPGAPGALLVASLLFALYLFTFTGVIQSSDGLSMFATVESLARQGEANSEQIRWMGLQQGSYGPDGLLYSRKGLGMPLLSLPLVWLALHWPALGLVQSALLLNPILSAWTGALIYLAVLRLGFGRAVAMIVGLTSGLATLTWPYTQTFFSDPVAGWGLFAALYGLLAYSQDRRKRLLFVAGVAWSLAYLARAVNLVTLPLFAGALYYLLFVRMQKRPDETIREWTLFGIPVAAGGLLSLWWNWLRFGHPLDSGYAPTETFSADWLLGIWGLVAGPARGLIWYSPILLLAVGGAVWFWRRERWLLLLSLGVSLIYLLLYSKWYMWHGGYSWGPRFLVPIVPFLVLISAPAWVSLMVEGKAGRGGRLGVILLLLLSLSVQWLGLLVPFGLVQEWLAANVQPLFAPETFTRLSYSPLLRQWAFLSQEQIHFAWWRGDNGRPLFGLLVLLFATIATGAGLVVHWTRREDADATTVRLYTVAVAIVGLAFCAALRVPLSGTTALVQTNIIESEEKEKDLILHLDSDGWQSFANVYHGRAATLGLFDGGGSGDEMEEQIRAVETTYDRVWYLPPARGSQAGGWEEALRRRAYLLQEWSELEGERILLFALPAEGLIETGVGIRFGEPAPFLLKGYRINPKPQIGGELRLELEWESLVASDESFHVFVHLVDESGQRIAQRDGQPVLWMRPTSSWVPGETIVDRYAFLLGDDLAPGSYTLRVGLYRPKDGVRLRTSPPTREDSVVIGPFEIGAAD